MWPSTSARAAPRLRWTLRAVRSDVRDEKKLSSAELSQPVPARLMKQVISGASIICLCFGTKAKTASLAAQYKLPCLLACHAPPQGLRPLSSGPRSIPAASTTAMQCACTGARASLSNVALKVRLFICRLESCGHDPVFVSTKPAAGRFRPFYSTIPIGRGMVFRSRRERMRQSGGSVPLRSKSGAGKGVAVHLPDADRPDLDVRGPRGRGVAGA
ncbi:hypothetical protein ROA7023_00336 [Roseisalinus antarcticus]|uniref:Uncharacterized protein n=1 Tax=Roseisalinus antarcticus TaxID=254357 RepID=A0A1Y5RHP7_9RHOB|nr:hypothetical protein ROA7023_00336 [Roseisalinus antarcticus]